MTSRGPATSPRCLLPRSPSSLSHPLCRPLTEWIWTQQGDPLTLPETLGKKTGFFFFFTHPGRYGGKKNKTGHNNRARLSYPCMGTLGYPGETLNLGPPTGRIPRGSRTPTCPPSFFYPLHFFLCLLPWRGFAGLQMHEASGLRDRLCWREGGYSENILWTLSRYTSPTSAP